MSENNVENKGGGGDKKVVADRFLNDFKKEVDDRLSDVRSSIQKKAEKIGEKLLEELVSDKPLVKGLKGERKKEEGISADLFRAKRESKKKGEEMSDPRLKEHDDKRTRDLGTMQRYQKKRERPSHLNSPNDRNNMIMAPFKFKDWKESVLEEHGYDKATREEMGERLEKGKMKSKKAAKIRKARGMTEAKKPGAVSELREKTGAILKKCLESIATSYTLSMFIVYAYVFIRQIPQLNKILCPIGQEWVPAQVKRKSPKEAKRIGDKIAIVEKPFIGCFCALHIYAIIVIILQVYIIMYPTQFAIDILKNFAKNILGTES
jgi:hypothetical protein